MLSVDAASTMIAFPCCAALVAQRSYPAPLTRTSWAFSRVATSEAVGSKSRAFTVSFDKMTWSEMSLPPMIFATDSHWLTLTATSTVFALEDAVVEVVLPHAAVATIVNKAVASAGYDRTIRASVVSCVDQSICKYKIKYITYMGHQIRNRNNFPRRTI